MKRLKSAQGIFILLCCIIAIASFITAMLSVHSQVAFYYDQARDAYQAFSIWNGHHLKILGPPTDVVGIYHGVAWYYFLAPLYLLGHSNPIAVAYMLTGLLYLTVPLCGYTAYMLSKNKLVAFLSMAIYSAAPLFINFSHWISNPVLTVLVAPFLVFFLWKYISRPDIVPAGIVGMLYGIMIQSDFGFLPLLAIIPIYLLVFRLKPKMAQIVSFTFGLLLATSTFFIAAIKFHSNTIALIFQHFFSATTLQLSLTSVLLSFIDTFVQFLSTSYLCLPVLLAGVVLLYIAFKIRKKYPQERTKQIIFLEIWTMSILLLVIINHGNGDTLFFFAPILFSTAILLANILVMTFPSPVVLTIVLLVLFSFQMLRNGISISSQDSYLIIQPGMIYSTETQVIDYTYQQAHGQPFVINAITNPLYIATMWSYLYQFYGKSHYGYMPYWGGRSQADQLGSLPENPNTIPLRFLIIDPTDIDMIPPFWVTKITSDEDALSAIQEEKKIGQFSVQKRLFH